MKQSPSNILLIGGGHAHVAVLADWIRDGIPAERATLVTPFPTLRYSGMVPGWISGQYDRDTGLVDIAGLAAKAGIEMVLDRAVGIDPVARSVPIAGGRMLDFDIASIDTGGVGRAAQMLGDDPRLVDVRPIDGFVERIDACGKAGRIAVIGGGAGGVELAFALNNRAGFEGAEVTLVAGASGLLPDHSRAVRKAVATEFARQNVALLEADANLRGGALFAGDQSLEPLDLAVAALGSAPPEFFQHTGLDTDAHGFIAVDEYQRSTSHPYIFAAGDVAARMDRNVPHSGVHAVFAGPVLADNLRAAVAGLPPSKSYRPRWTNLYLLSTGQGEAIASYGPVCTQGRWVARLKDWIDTRWISKYAKLADGA